jgi:hypothetical protein
MDWLLFALVLVIPAVALATGFRWLGIEYAVAYVWVVFFLSFAWSMWMMWRRDYSDL